MTWTALTLAVLIVVLAGLEAWLDPGHHHFPGATILFALVASAVLVGASTLLRLLGLERQDRSDD